MAEVAQEVPPETRSWRGGVVNEYTDGKLY